MNIVMLGHSNAGKTTYMSSMYRELATRGVNGFWLCAQEDADHRRLLTAANGVAVGRYPPASDRRGEYPLTLRYGSNQVIDFNWKDHRGGALREKSSSSQTKALLDDVAGADAIMLFLDSADLGPKRSVNPAGGAGPGP
jgi:GTPase SAR1 family protein